MRIVAAIVKWLIVAVVAIGLGATAWLLVAPPDLIRVATGYAAKIVCSSTFVSGRDPGQALAVDVQAPGHPLLGYVTVDVDREAGTATAALLDWIATSRAVVRPGTGCASVPSGSPDVARMHAAVAVATPAAEWPGGEGNGRTRDPRVAAILDDPDLTGPGMRAVVVARDGRLVAERYGAGFSNRTPLLGWSMTKTVTAAIIGTLVRDGRMALDDSGLFEEWSGDGRGAITVAELMAMSSGLAFNEDYGDVTDVTRMLYLERDMAAFAADKEAVAAPGERFSYSSGTSVMLSRLWQNAFESQSEALNWPRQALFGPLGMSSAVLETDASGTFVGSSYLYARARDWARFGEFLRNDGVWDGERILPEGYVQWMREPAPASNGAYGRGQLWLRGPDAGVAEGEDPDAGFDLPDDTFWLIGHDGQSVAVVPSERLVVVRMGLTPSSLGYRPQSLLEALVDALADTPAAEAEGDEPAE